MGPSRDVIAYLVTFRTYGSWLHGDERGSVSRHGNRGTGQPTLPPDAVRDNIEAALLTNDAVELSGPHRPVVMKSIMEVCEHRGWLLHALNVRTNHVHVVVSGGGSVERMLGDFKAYATRRLRQAALAAPDDRLWSRHGSTRYLWEDEDVAAAIHYVLDEQGPDLGGTYRAPESEARP